MNLDATPSAAMARFLRRRHAPVAANLVTALLEDPSQLSVAADAATLAALRAEQSLGPGCPLAEVTPGRVTLSTISDMAQRIRRGLTERPIVASQPETPSAVPEALSADQARAVRTALTHPVTLIAGGPGTGKTTTLSALLATWSGAHLAAQAVVLSPTGKAAQRLQQSMATAASRFDLGEQHAAALSRIRTHTVHKALGASASFGRPYRRGPHSPIAADLIVVDEASMIDLPLFASLLDATPPHARLVFVGDPDQLPPVGLGAPFQELCAVPERLGLAAAHLETVHRVAARSPLHALFAAFRAGDADAFIVALDAPGTVSWQAPTYAGLQQWSTAAFAPLAAALQQASPAPALEALGTARVLTPLRDGPWGAQTLASMVGAALAPAPGRLPALMTRNIVSLDLRNGDEGVTDGSGTFWCLDRQGVLREVRGLGAGTLEPGLAMTVHKSQGSEYAKVAVCLPPRPGPWMSRALVYTALTRAKTEVALFATEDALRAALSAPPTRIAGVL